MLKLRRITSGASWIPQIDGLRFVAILSVVLFHADGQVHHRGLGPITVGPHWMWVERALDVGDRGVLLFFVISGYILARPFLRQYRLGGREVSTKAYFLRRLTRLEPPYLLALAIYAVAEMTTGRMLAWHRPASALLPHLLASSFYLHNVIYDQMSLINFVTWSLEVEVQFYLLAPLLGMLYRIESTALRRSVILALMAIGGVVSLSSGFRIRGSLLGNSQYFLAGFLLADFLEIPRHSERTHWRWDLVSVIGWALIFGLPRETFAIYAWFPVLILPTYLAAFYGKASNWFFRQSFIAITGGMCYSIYLLHTLIISVAFRPIEHLRYSNGTLTFFVQMVLLAVSAFAVSTVYFVLIERPCMDPTWPKKLWHKLRPHPTAE